MEVNNEAFLERTQPSEQILPAEEKIAEATEETETAKEIEITEGIETAKQIKLAELLQPIQILQEPQQNGNKNGRPLKTMKNSKKLLNFFKKKPQDRDPSPTVQIEETEPAEPPEKWTTCRLRQHARELMREKVTAIAEEEKLLTLEIKRQENLNRFRNVKAKQREELPLMKEVLAKLSPVKLEEEQEVDMDVQVKVELVVGIGPDEEQSQPLEREKLTPKQRQKRKETKRERFRGLQSNKREKKARRTGTDEEKSLRFERRRIKTAMRFANETEVQRLLRLERLKIARSIRLATETEEEISLRLARLDERERQRIAKAAQLLQQEEVDIGPDEEKSQPLEREKLTPKKRPKQRETNRQRFRRLQNNNRRKEVLRNETEDERSLRLEPSRIARAMRLANETEEQRFVRLERSRMARLNRLVTETEEEKSLRIEKEMIAKDRRKLKLESLRVARIQQLLLQQMEVANFVVDMKEEDQKADDIDDFEISKFIPKVLLHEESSAESESPTKSSTATRDTQIKKEIKFDVVSNLLHSICGKSHPQQHNRLQRFDNLGTSRSSSYILSTVVWHKLNSPTGMDYGIDENSIKLNRIIH